MNEGYKNRVTANEPPVNEATLDQLFAQLNAQDVEQFYNSYQLWSKRRQITLIQQEVAVVTQKIAENTAQMHTVEPTAIALATLAQLEAKNVSDVDVLDQMLERGDAWLDHTMQLLLRCEELDLIGGDYTQWCMHALEGAYEWIASMSDNDLVAVSSKPGEGVSPTTTAIDEQDENTNEVTEDELLRKLMSEDGDTGEQLPAISPSQSAQTDPKNALATAPDDPALIEDETAVSENESSISESEDELIISQHAPATTDNNTVPLESKPIISTLSEDEPVTPEQETPLSKDEPVTHKQETPLSKDASGTLENTATISETEAEVATSEQEETLTKDEVEAKTEDEAVGSQNVATTEQTNDESEITRDVEQHSETTEQDHDDNNTTSVTDTPTDTLTDTTSDTLTDTTSDTISDTLTDTSLDTTTEKPLADKVTAQSANEHDEQSEAVHPQIEEITTKREDERQESEQKSSDESGQWPYIYQTISEAEAVPALPEIVPSMPLLPEEQRENHNTTQTASEKPQLTEATQKQQGFLTRLWAKFLSW